ncbi:amidohydrolase family protein [Rhodovulum sp. DZ06]|uniref:amidohydrolase family protein n=1 Tax=Rhodovulum sp. DZ06 TaxID=3425126 RepID=UPI003D3594E6
MTDLLIRNAWIVPGADGAAPFRGALAVSGGRIEALIPGGEAEPRAAETIDAQGGVVAAGLVNTHCHAPDSLFRGLVENLPLEPWLQTVWKAEGAILSEETCRIGARLGFAELALTGCTSVIDMFWHPEQSAHAGAEIGLRTSCGGLFFDFPGMDKRGPEGRAQECIDFFEAFPRTDMMVPGVFPHGSYTVGPEGLQKAHEISSRYNGLYSVHAAETQAENADILNRYGNTVIRHMHKLGILDERTVLAHCVHLDDEEIAILAETRAVVAHNPVSNLKLASGIARIPDMLKAGVRVTLGTDGAISGNDIDMWLALRLAAMLHKGAAQDATLVTTEQAWRMATLSGAEAMGLGDVTGSLEVGKYADLMLVDVNRPHAQPLFDPLTHLVYSAGKSDVTDVWVGGRRIVRGGKLESFDIAPTLEQVKELTPKIAASIA